jgi:glycosyltransferase involved in cell wall biosynthesis
MPQVTSKAVLIQCYNKPDTTAQALNSLLKCRNKEEFSLVIWQDSEIGNPSSAAHNAGRTATTALIQAMLPIIEKGFKNVSYYLNEQNRGCYATCKIGIDKTLETNDFVIFAEDDAIFSEDALDWFSASLSIPEYADPNCVAVTGESIFFD